MEVLECIKTRRGIRKYLDKPVTWDDVSMILEAGRYAPSSGNLQNWKFVVVLDKPKREAIAEASKNQLWMATAPVHIVVVGEPVKADKHYGERGKDLYTKQNCAAAAQNMMLEAHNLGLGACWVGAFDVNKVKRILAMPEEVDPQTIITIGYPDEKPVESVRLPLEAVMFFNTWRGRIRNVPAYFGYFGTDIQKGIKKSQEVLEKAGKTIAEKTKDMIDDIKEKIKKK